MKTPIFDFVKQYADSNTSRLHMPGHKGVNRLGCETFDLTEIEGADALYEADGIIRESEKNASALFHTADTLYSTEGSSQCIRAMLYLALLEHGKTPIGTRPLIVAARNAHKTFLLAAALLDFDIVWLCDEYNAHSLCTCNIQKEQLENVLSTLPRRPVAVYVTSPDYLGGMLDIKGLAEIAHAYGVPLLVDDAHGAYRHFLKEDKHPIALGADICCDSAHKTLPVLTGGAYLQIAKSAPTSFRQNARRAMAMFGSTSPSYLILQSLDLANAYLSDGYEEKLSRCISKIEKLKTDLQSLGWKILESDELKLTLCASACGYKGSALAERLRSEKIECEYADPDYLVLMFTPENPMEDYEKIYKALCNIEIHSEFKIKPPAFEKLETVFSARQALFSDYETIKTEDAIGRILAAPTVSCPPAVPIAVSGERLTKSAIALLKYYGNNTVDVIK